jgi:hypothetical protein
MPTDAVTAVVPDDATPETLRKLGDGRTDVAEASAVPDRGDPGVPAPARHIDDVQRLLRGVPDDERGRGVPVEAAQAGGDVALTMSPGRSTSSPRGMPWHTTWLQLVQTEAGKPW